MIQVFRFNGCAYDVNIGNYALVICEDGCPQEKQNPIKWPVEASIQVRFANGYTLRRGKAVVLAHCNGPFNLGPMGLNPDCASLQVLLKSDFTFQLIGNGNDFVGLFHTPTNTLVDQIGLAGEPKPFGSGWAVAGVADGTVDRRMTRKPIVSSGNCGDWSTSAGTFGPRSSSLPPGCTSVSSPRT